MTHTNRDNWQMTENRAGGATCYIGAKSSRQMLRVYDKAAESKGENNSIRWELQSRKEVAHAVAGKLVCGKWAGVWAENVVRLVDFRNRQSGRGDRGERLEWFARVVGSAQKAVLALAKPNRTVEETVSWLRRQVGPSLAVGLAHFGGDVQFLLGLVEDGRARWKPKHRILLAAA